MLKYDEQYSIKSRTGNIPTQDKWRHDKVEVEMLGMKHAKKKVASRS